MRLLIPEVQPKERAEPAGRQGMKKRCKNGFLSYLCHRCRCTQSQDPLGSSFRRNDDERGRVRRHHAGEDARVDDEEIVGSVDFGVYVDNGGTTGSAVIGAELGRADPVV